MKNQVVGLGIAIVDDQGIVRAQGFGYADAAEKMPATPEAEKINPDMTCILEVQAKTWRYD